MDHVIKLEKWFDNTTTEGLPSARCCRPPSSGRVGGAPSYAEYLDAIGDPAHPDAEQMSLPGPEQFDPNVNRPEGARGRCQRIVGNMEAAPARLALKKTSSANQKGPQSYACSELGRTPTVRCSMRSDKGLDD